MNLANPRPPHDELDLLLVNRSNFRWRPVYPYAFVMLSALAKRAGLTVVRDETMGVPRERLREHVRSLLTNTRPRWVGVHLRQVDSLRGDFHFQQAYHPIQDTEDLIRYVREFSDAKVLLGGFGFTSQARILMERVRPDFGIRGEPDAFLPLLRRGHFPSAETLKEVPNLLWWDGSELRENRREYFAPFDGQEYDAEIVQELRAFYGYQHRAASVAIELSRGCGYQCYFCSEPFVKGRNLRQRSLDAVSSDVDFVLAHGMRNIWLVCSELNQGNSELALEVAERMMRHKERLPEFEWFAYTLPRWLTKKDYETLLRSGFNPHWNDYMSLDDRNLRATKVPYRSKHIVSDLSARTELQCLDSLTWFVGNAHADRGSLLETARTAERLGLAEQLPGTGGIILNRPFVYDSENEQSSGSRENTISYTRELKPVDFDPLLPSFHVPEALNEWFTDHRQAHEFSDWFVHTFLSRSFRKKVRNHSLLISSFSPESFLGLLDDTRQELRELAGDLDLPEHARDTLLEMARMQRPEVLSFFHPSEEASKPEAQSSTLVELWFSLFTDKLDSLYQTIGIPTRDGEIACSFVEVHELVHAKFDSVAGVLSVAHRETIDAEERDFGRLAILSLLANYNVAFTRPSRALFGSTTKDERNDSP